MCICRELEPMAEHQTQNAFKGKEGHFLMVTIPNIAYSKQNIDTQLLYGSRDHFIVPDQVKNHV